MYAHKESIHKRRLTLKNVLRKSRAHYFVTNNKYSCEQVLTFDMSSISQEMLVMQRCHFEKVLDTVPSDHHPLKNIWGKSVGLEQNDFHDKECYDSYDIHIQRGRTIIQGGKSVLNIIQHMSEYSEEYENDYCEECGDAMTPI